MVALRTASEVEVRSTVNSEVYVASLFPIQNEDGEVVDLVEFAKDVTLSRDLQDKLLQTERLRALGEMASGTAHEFNNTLAGVLGQVELLLATEPDAHMERGLRLIAQAASDGAATVRRIQNFSKTSRGEEVVPADLNQIVLDAVEVCAPRWKDQSERDGVTVLIRPELRASSQVAGVPSELREVLVNILLNAIEAMPAGGTVAMRTGENTRWVWVSITDQGVGMTNEVRRHIFDPFYTTKGLANSGLGMSVVYGIIKLHRGDIKVSSEEGQGTTVTIRLPKARNLPAKPQPVIEAEPARPLRMLVADDDARLADMLQQMLSLDGHEVTVCHGGAAALEELAATPYDVVLTDLGMPEVSGWDVIGAARKLQPGICTGLVTGWGVQLEDVELNSKGVDAVIPKPYSMIALRATVAQLSELRQSRAVVALA